MKEKIDKRIQATDEAYVDALSEQDYPLDELEIHQISSQVKKKYQHRMKRKSIRLRKVILVAAVLIILSSQLTALGEIKKTIIEYLFHDNGENLASSGKLIERSDEHQGIKVSIRGIIGYDKVVAVIYDIEKTDGIAFKGNTTAFSGYIEVEDGARHIQYRLNDNREIKSERTGFKRAYVATISNYFDNKDYIMDEDRNIQGISLDNVQNFEGKQMKLVIEEIAERYSSKDDSTFDLAQYISTHPDVKKHENSGDEMLLFRFQSLIQGIEAEPYKPPVVIDNEHLGLIPFERRPKVTIDNIGLIDDELHIRTSYTMNPWDLNAVPYAQSSVVRGENGSTAIGNASIRLYRYGDSLTNKCWSPDNYYLGIRNVRGGFLLPYYTSYSNDPNEKVKVEKYEIYKIGDARLLKDLKFSALLKYSEAATQDHWEIPFQAEMESTIQNIAYDKEIQGQLGQSWKVDEINLANVYLSIQLSCQNEKALKSASPMPIKVIMEDGTEEVLLEEKDYQYVVNPASMEDDSIKECYAYENREDSTINIDGFFLKAKDITKVQAIQIGNVKIPVEKKK